MAAAGNNVGRLITAALPRHPHPSSSHALPSVALAAAVAAMLLALSMPFGAAEVSPRGADAGALRTNAPAAPDPAGSAARALQQEQQWLASEQPKLLGNAIEGFTTFLAPSGGASESSRAWARSQLGLATKKLAIIDNDQNLLKQAIADYRNALAYYRGAGDRQNAGILSANLLTALLSLKGRDAAEISRADVQSLAEAALAETDRARQPLIWARLQVQIGTLLLATGARADDAASVERAIAAFRSGLENAQHDGQTPREWAEAENLLGNALEFLGDAKGSTALLREALKTLNNAWVLYQYAGLDQYQFFFDGRISTLSARLAQLEHPSSAQNSAASQGTGSAGNQP
ncbi:MAG TPA: hypothetical protein VL418_13950 [Devosiaceae bacterium]|nr:hypothetical protein [Devosiaceae bacterium]